MRTAPTDAAIEGRFRMPATISPQARLTNRLGTCRSALITSVSSSAPARSASCWRGRASALRPRQRGRDALAEVACQDRPIRRHRRDWRAKRHQAASELRRAVRVSATARTTTAAPTTILPLITSCSNNAPSSTATTGLTYA